MLGKFFGERFVQVAEKAFLLISFASDERSKFVIIAPRVVFSPLSYAAVHFTLNPFAGLCNDNAQSSIAPPFELSGT